MLDAMTIYQTHLDLVSEAVWNKDDTTLAAAMTYPHALSTDRGLETINDGAAMIRRAHAFRQSLLDRGATGYIRVVVAAAFVGDAEDRIEGFHRVYVLNGATHVIAPYASEASLTRVGDEWLGSGVRSVIGRTRYPVADVDDD